MKKIYLTIAVILAVGCAKDSSGSGQGILSLGVEPVAEILEITKADVGDYASIPEIGDFKLKITNWASEIAWEGYFKDWKDDLKLAGGDYQADIWSGSPDEEGAAKPYFFGSEVFAIEADKTTSVTLEPALGNCIVKIEVGNYLKEYFKSYKFSITTGAQNSFSVYEYEDEDDAVFMDAYKFTLNCTFTHKNGTKINFSKSFDNLSPATCYSVKVELSNMEGLSFTVTFNDTVETITIDEEINA